MSPEEDEMLMFHSFVFPDSFPTDAATPGSGKFNHPSIS